MEQVQIEFRNPKYLARLTDAQVHQIKEYLRDERGIKQEWIARQFGVKQSTIAYYNKQVKAEKVLNN